MDDIVERTQIRLKRQKIVYSKVQICFYARRTEHFERIFGQDAICTSSSLGVLIKYEEKIG